MRSGSRRIGARRATRVKSGGFLKRNAHVADGNRVTKSPSAVSGKVASGRMSRRGGGTGPQPYDFRRPIKLSREHMRNLQMCFETYARSCGTLLTTRLRAVSQVGLLAIEQLTYEEYQTQLNNPTVLAVVTLEPLSGSILFEVPLSTAMASIDHLLGGPGGAQPERPLTDLEMPLLRGLIEKMLGELAYGLEAMVPVHPKLGAIEYNPQFVRTIAPATPWWSRRSRSGSGPRSRSPASASRSPASCRSWRSRPSTWS